MLHLRHIDPIVVALRADPFDPYDAFLEIHGHHEPIAVPLDIEHDAVAADDAGAGVKLPHVGRAEPARLADFLEPRVKSRFQRRLIFVPGAGRDELSERAPRDDPHWRKSQVPKLGTRMPLTGQDVARR